MSNPLGIIVEKSEQLKSQRKFSEARKLIEESIAQYPGDFQLYEELGDILLYM